MDIKLNYILLCTFRMTKNQKKNMYVRHQTAIFIEDYATHPLSTYVAGGGGSSKMETAAYRGRGRVSLPI